MAPALRRDAALFVSSPLGQGILSVLVNEGRIRAAMPVPDPTKVALELGRIAGHQEAIDIILLMAEPLEADEPIPETYPTPKMFKNPREED